MIWLLTFQMTVVAGPPVEVHTNGGGTALRLAVILTTLENPVDSEQ